MSKVTIIYDEPQDDDLHMTIKMTMPKKLLDGPAENVVKFAVDHYNKQGKYSSNPLDASAFHLKLAGGHHIDNAGIVADHFRGGDELHLMSTYEGATAQVRPPAPAKPEPTPAVPAKKGPRADGKVRCRNFGCNKFFDPSAPPEECVYHKAAPIFHETAKWWSCCPQAKSYDFEGFQATPGCERGFHSDAEPEGKKRFLGGTDLREENAPKRIDGGEEVLDGRKKLDRLKTGLVAIGIPEDQFERVWGRLAARCGGIDGVVERLHRDMGALLQEYLD
mmetsp:Transcript_47174/g.102689  ORF Transcript_47174/g.102689 Transcript_47174/m.102689 type:complete len:277 (+) Transcript_47174:73-903(+)